MTNRAYWTLTAILVAIVAGQVAMFVHLRRNAGSTSIRCRAFNVGFPLAAGDGNVVVYPAGHRDEPVAQGRVGEPVPVPPGTYDLQIQYSRARDRQERWIENLTIASGERAERNVDFAAGQLLVSSLVGGREPTAGEVVTYLFKPEDHNRVITALRPGEAALIGAGKYDLRAVLLEEAQEKAVQWIRDVTVKAGVLTEQPVSFRRGFLLVKARNAGKNLPPDAVKLEVHQAGDAQEELLETGSAGVPLGLATGHYDVKATFAGPSDAPFQWIRSVEVKDNQTAERVLDFSAGTALFRAVTRGGSELTGYQVYIYFYLSGDHQEPVTYTPAGQPVVLSSGRYDVRANFFRSHDRPDIWKRGVEIRAGQTLEQIISFASGKVLVRAYEEGGKELIGDNVFLDLYRAGERTTPAARARSGEEVTLTEGTYDVRATDSRTSGQDVWITGVRVESGKARQIVVTFPSRRPPSSRS